MVICGIVFESFSHVNTLFLEFQVWTIPVFACSWWCENDRNQTVVMFPIFWEGNLFSGKRVVSSDADSYHFKNVCVKFVFYWSYKPITENESTTALGVATNLSHTFLHDSEWCTGREAAPVITTSIEKTLGLAQIWPRSGSVLAAVMKRNWVRPGSDLKWVQIWGTEANAFSFELLNLNVFV